MEGQLQSKMHISDGTPNPHVVQQLTVYGQPYKGGAMKFHFLI